MSLGDVMRMAIERSELRNGLDADLAIKAWVAVIGPAIAAKSPRPTVARDVMTIRIANAPLRHELSMNRSRLVNAVNRAAGKTVVTDIRFIS